MLKLTAALLATCTWAQPVQEITERQSEPLRSEEFYDNILLKFDKNCLSDLNLAEHYKKVLLLPTAVAGDVDFQAVGEPGAAKSVLEGVNGDDFATLLDRRLIKTKDSLKISHTMPDTDKAILANDRRRKLSVTERLDQSSLRRALKDVDPNDREEDILASLHLLAITKLVGIDKAEQLLDLEDQQDQKRFNDFLSASDLIGINDSAKSLTAVGENATTSSLDGLTSTKVTEYESLDFIEIHVVRNSILKEALQPLTRLLPCLEFEAEPDRTKQPLGELDMRSLRVLQNQVSSANTTGASPETTTANKSFTGVQADGTKYIFNPPDDPHFDAQWYLKSASQGERFGSQVIDGWAYIIKNLTANATAARSLRATADERIDISSLLENHDGLTVAVLDSGCSRNPDLIHQFWRNYDTPGCTNSTYVGDSDAKADSHGIAGDCVGYDFGNDQPDPTLEISSRIHGSSTSGLIGAEAANGVGISGVCPFCKVMCLKIYDSERQRITMTSVVRALDYIGRKDIKISNHSYGGFGASQIEKAAHEALNRLGHLAVCSSGNNACNIDPVSGKDDNDRCKGDDGSVLGPFTPATYDVPGILSIGGTAQDGTLAWFSNYGAEAVDVFAPGDGIVTLYGEDQLASVKGTSFSSPIVAGIAAVLWSARPELTHLQVKDLLMNTGIPVDALQGKARQGRIVSLARALVSDTADDMLFTSADALGSVAAVSLITNFLLFLL